MIRPSADISIIPSRHVDGKYEIQIKFHFERYTIWFSTNDGMTKREADVRVIQLAAHYDINTDGFIVPGLPVPDKKKED